MIRRYQYPAKVEPLHEAAEPEKTLDQWEPRLGVPLFDLKRQQHTYPWLSLTEAETLPVEEDVLADKWQPRLISPLFDVPRTQWSYPSWFWGLEEWVPAPAIPVDLDRWEPRAYQPLFDIPRSQWLYPTYFSLGEPVPGQPLTHTTLRLTVHLNRQSSRTVHATRKLTRDVSI